MSQLFSSSGSCGPVNPLQNLGKHAGATNSSQHQRFVRENSAGPAFRSSPSPSVSNGNNEFQTFSNGQSVQGVEGSFQFHHLDTANINGNNVYQARSHSATPTSDWASDFSKLSVGGGSQDMRFRQSPGLSNQMIAPSPSPGLYHQIQPQYAMRPYPTSSFAQQTEHQQVHKLEDQQVSFENAFAEVERSLNDEQETSLPSTTDNELSGVAQNIIDSVNETSHSINKTTANKMKNSNFMALMDQLSKKNVVLEGEKFVDGVSGTEVKPEQLSRQEDVRGVYEEPKLPDFKKNTSSHPSLSEIPLQDPFEYMQKMNIDPTKSTPFEIAQALNPGVSMNDWEEKYNEDVDWTQ